MKKGKILALIGALIMALMIVYSLSTNTFMSEGSILMGMAWGQMSMVDLYVGFLAVYGWIWFREKGTGSRIIWFILMMTMGSLATCLYIAKAFNESNDKTEFFFGRK